MRQIKFRAWDKDLKKMCEDFLSLVEDAIYQHQANPWQDERFIPMQFTGLYDKHGRVEIYEGDIVRRKGSDGTIEIVAVEYRGGRYNIGDYDPTYGYEIIGNIYENPELLNSL
jgi:YopX protein